MTTTTSTMTALENDAGDLFLVPDTLKARLQRLQSWDDGKVEAALLAYRQFMKLKLQLEDFDAKILSPSLTVDLVWHQHLLDPVSYVDACQAYFGCVCGHDPDGGLDQEARKKRISTTKVAMKSLFGRSIDTDTEIWSFETENRRLSACGDLRITLRVRNQTTGNARNFEVNKETQMGNLFASYAEYVNVHPSNLRSFIRRGRISPEDTPLSLDLDDQDKIYCTIVLKGC